MDTKPAIVVCVDGSQQSEAAAILASRMCHEDDTVYIYSCFVRTSFLSPQHNLRAIHKEYVSKAAELFKGKISDDRVVCAVEQCADPRESIAEFAHDKLARMVFMGSRGLSGLDKLLLGSTSLHVLHHYTHGSVIIAHSVRKDLDRLHILLCTDGSAHAQRAADLLANSAHKTDNITILTCFPRPPKFIEGEMTAAAFTGDMYPEIIENPNFDKELVESKEKALQLLQASKHKLVAANPSRVDGDRIQVVAEDTYNPKETILKMVKDLDVDIVVMGTKGAGAIGRMVFGSVSHHTIQHVPETAVMIVH